MIKKSRVPRQPGPSEKEHLKQLETSYQELETRHQELKELLKNKDTFTHMLVHDMKNPLTAILGTLCLFKSNNFNLKTELHGLLVDAHIQSVKLLCMIDEISTLRRMQTKEFKINKLSGDIVPLIQQSLMMMAYTAKHKKLTLQFIPPTKPIWVMFDYQMIERVINNLLNNSIKYAPDPSEILVTLAQSDSMATISITNWGKPIPSAYHHKIFNAFARAESENSPIAGTGLGLAFCKLAVDAHQGNIYVDSPVPPKEIGARFCLELPLAAENELSVPDSAH